MDELCVFLGVFSLGVSKARWTGLGATRTVEGVPGHDRGGDIPGHPCSWMSFPAQTVMGLLLLTFSSSLELEILEGFPEVF